MIWESGPIILFSDLTDCKWQGSTNLEAIQIIKKPGGSLKDSFLDEG